VRSWTNYCFPLTRSFKILIVLPYDGSFMSPVFSSSSDSELNMLSSPLCLLLLYVMYSVSSWYVKNHTTIDDFRGEILQMSEILGFKILKGLIFIEVVFKKIIFFSPNIKLNNINCTSLAPYKIERKSIQRGFSLRISWLNFRFALDILESIFLKMNHPYSLNHGAFGINSRTYPQIKAIWHRFFPPIFMVFLREWFSP